MGGGIEIELINAHYKGIYFSETLVFFWLCMYFIARVRFFRVWILISLKRILIKEGISKIILNSFEWISLGNNVLTFLSSPMHFII